MATAKKTTPATTIEGAIKLSKKDAALLEELSEELKVKPETVIRKALSALQRIENDKKYFGIGKLLEAD